MREKGKFTEYLKMLESCSGKAAYMLQKYIDLAFMKLHPSKVKSHILPVHEKGFGSPNRT